MTRQPRFNTPSPLEIKAMVDEARAARAAYVGNLISSAFRRLFGGKAAGRTV